MLTINNISFYLGNKQLYDKCSLFIKPKDKIGLIGANGAGKSTLLKLITGELKPDEGDIKLQNGFTLAEMNALLQNGRPVLNASKGLKT